MESEALFGIGDVVTLKSGGMKMTVDNIYEVDGDGDWYVDAIFFTSGGIARVGGLPQECLVLFEGLPQ